MHRRSFLSGLLAGTALSVIPKLSALALNGGGFGRNLSVSEAQAMYSRLTTYLDALFIFDAPTEEEAKRNIVQTEDIFLEALRTRPTLASLVPRL